MTIAEIAGRIDRGEVVLLPGSSWGPLMRAAAGLDRELHWVVEVAGGVISIRRGRTPPCRPGSADHEGVPAVTDREMLLHLCRKLGLRAVPWPAVGHPVMDPKSYAAQADEPAVGGCRVFLGSGDGYTGFFAAFDFDAEGQVVGHTVGE